MFISFNGVIYPYTYWCPHAHRLRNIEKVRIPREKPEDLDPEELSRRMRGIELHKQAHEWILGQNEQFEFVTETLKEARSAYKADPEHNVPEREYKLTAGEDVFYARPDLLTYNSVSGVIDVYDWKFANPDYGATRYYDETEFFLSVATMADNFPVTMQARLIVHFPEKDYTLPIKEYPPISLMKTQSMMFDRAMIIKNDRICQPNPAPSRCRFCDFRSEDTGGNGVCEHTIM